jgi:hypothetical protein
MMCRGRGEGNDGRGEARLRVGWERLCVWKWDVRGVIYVFDWIQGACCVMRSGAVDL